MKLVVDVNVLISGSLWPGNPAQLIEAFLEGSATLCTSSAILTELEEVLQREKFRRRLENRGHLSTEFISLLRASALVVDGPGIPIPPGLRDPDDIHILTCACLSSAAGIVTGDADLLSMGSYGGVPIYTVRQMLDKLGISAA